MTDRNKVGDGGAAFPTGSPEHGGSSGMTLKQYFAGQALAGLNIEEWIDKALEDDSMGTAKAYGSIARYTHGVADAMIAQGRKGATE